MLLKKKIVKGDKMLLFLLNNHTGETMVDRKD